jgi:hypothetical protein
MPRGTSIPATVAALMTEWRMAPEERLDIARALARPPQECRS